MRKLVISAGLLLAAALFPGAPAQAAVGCQCVKFGAPSACMPTVHDCNVKMGGICIAPCSYTGTRAVRHTAAKRHTVKAGTRHVAMKPKPKAKLAKKPAPKKNKKKM